MIVNIKYLFKKTVNSKTNWKLNYFVSHLLIRDIQKTVKCKITLILSF